MKRPLLWAAAGAAFVAAFAFTWLYVPVRQGVRLVAPPTAEQVAQMRHQFAREAKAAPRENVGASALRRARAELLLDGQTVVVEAVETEWAWAWNIHREQHETSLGAPSQGGSSLDVSGEEVEPAPAVQVEIGDFVWWNLLFLEQALLLLFAGMALAVWIRRSRRRAAAQ